jgi:hypothetical protein
MAFPPHEVLLAMLAMLAVVTSTESLLIMRIHRGTQNHKVHAQNDDQDTHGHADIRINPSIGCAIANHGTIESVQSNWDGYHHC